MNHPARALEGELRWIAEAGLGFVDLTLEPPCAASWQIDVSGLRRALDALELGIVGHTAYYLPCGHPFEDVRRAATASLAACLDVFVALGADWMTVHPDAHAPMQDRPFIVQQNLATLGALLDAGRARGIGVMVENVPAGFNTAEQLAELLDPLPELGLHLDIGHANLGVATNTAESILARFGPRLRHVHLHDNNGQSDLHLPLGAGSIDVPRMVRAIRGSGYDGTITLEVFSHDRRHFEYSRDVLRRLWESAKAS